MSQLIIMNTFALQMSPGFQKGYIYDARLPISKSFVLRGHLKEAKGVHKEFLYTCKCLPIIVLSHFPAALNFQNDLTTFGSGPKSWFSNLS